MDIFNLPLDTTHLRHQLKWLSYLRNMPFRDYAAEVYRILDDPAMSKMWARRRTVSRLIQKYGINDQRTQVWHSKRGEMITASEVTKAFATATPSGRRELLLRKIEGPKPGDGGTNAACAWGNQFEPVAKELYCKINGGGHIVDTSCVVHPKHAFLGASPDGIYITNSVSDPRWGKLVEFKCPISRKFDENTPIPDAYYHQMQMQMECTSIDECDYVEMQFATLTKTEWSTRDIPYKGRFAVYDSGFVSYDTDNSPHWRSSLENRDEEFRIVHWALASWRIANVPRDFGWLPSHIDELTSTWEEVLAHRANGTVPEKALKLCDPPINSHDDQCSLPPEPVLSPEISDDLSSVHKMNATTLQFSLG